MPYFSTPTAPRVPLTAGPGHPGHSLFVHYRPHEAGANVFIVGGAVTTVEPDYASVTPEHVFLGGHIYEVTDAVAAVLTAAGYALLDYTPPAPSTPLPGTPDPDEPLDLEPSYGLANHFDTDAIFDTARYV